MESISMRLIGTVHQHRTLQGVVMSPFGVLISGILTLILGGVFFGLIVEGLYIMGVSRLLRPQDLKAMDSPDDKAAIAKIGQAAYDLLLFKAELQGGITMAVGIACGGAIAAARLLEWHSREAAATILFFSVVASSIFLLTLMKTGEISPRHKIGAVIIAVATAAKVALLMG